MGAIAFSNAALNRALAELTTLSAQLVAATNAHDSERVRTIARRATEMWLAASAASRQLATSNGGRSPMMDAASEMLAVHRRDLIRLFKNARRNILATEMRRVLDELGDTLAASTHQVTR